MDSLADLSYAADWQPLATAAHNRPIRVWDAFTGRSVVASLTVAYDDASEPRGWLTASGEVVGDPTHWQEV